MATKKLSDEAKFLIVIILLILSVPLFFYLLSRGPSDIEKEQLKRQKEMTVLVTESDKPHAPAPVSPLPALQSIRESARQGNYSTAHLQLSRMPRNSAGYKELLKEVVAANKGRAGLRQEPATEKTPLRYIDASSPRTRNADGIFLYLTDEGDLPRPWLCIQSFGSKIGLTSVKLKADGTAATVSTPSVAEKSGEKFAEYYDAPLNRESYALVKRIVAAGSSELVLLGGSGKKEHKITDQEKKALIRILDLYEALGGNIAPFQKK